MLEFARARLAQRAILLPAASAVGRPSSSVMGGPREQRPCHGHPRASGDDYPEERRRQGVQLAPREARVAEHPLVLRETDRRRRSASPQA